MKLRTPAIAALAADSAPSTAAGVPGNVWYPSAAMKKTLASSLVALCFLGAAPSLWARDKVDRVQLLNGDHLMGEIKKVERGILTYSTDSLDKVYIEWVDVARLTSPYTYQVETTDGTRYFGILVEPSSEGHLKIDWAETTVGEPAMADVVRIDPINSTLWSRVDGSLSVGYSFTKSSGVEQLSYAADAIYRQREFEAYISGSAITTDQETGRTTRQDYQSGYRRFFGNRWFSAYALNAQTNDELGLDLRTLIGAGIGRNLIQGNKAILSLLGGLAYTTERETTGEDREDVEFVGSVSADIFRFNTPKLDLDTTLTAFRSFDTGRLRGEFNVNLRWEIIKDFFWSLTFYDSYTSEPPSEEDERNDYGIVTSFGYSF